MGNCMRHEGSAAANWGGEDWGYLAEDGLDQKRRRTMTTKEEEEEEEEGLLLGGEKDGFGSLKMKGEMERGRGREVKIKMTKKQLEEMMGRVELKQMSVQQVLAQLIMSVSTSDSSSDPYEGDDHQRPWRPVLQSIPEVN